MPRLLSDERVRAMYVGGRADTAARRLSHFWAAALRLGLLPRRWVTLEVAGRKTGRPVRFPLGMARVEGTSYLVSMLGDNCNWVQNVRAAHGRAVLRRWRSTPCHLAEVPVSERAPILKDYLQHVPGARPHLPVDRSAPVTDFESIAARFPVFRVVPEAVKQHPRHRARWIAAGVVGLVVASTPLLFIKPVGAIPPLTLPAAPPTGVQPAAGIDGTWRVAQGSVAGFRVREQFLGIGDDVVGRTTAVSGTVTIIDGNVTAASFQVGLADVEIHGKPQTQFAKSLDVATDPYATFVLTQPLVISAGAADGSVVTGQATGNLTLRGVTRLVSFRVTGRWTGSALEALGSIPVAFADYGIIGPQGYGPVGSLADHGVAEFSVILVHA